MAREEELFDEEAGELGGVMTDDAMFLDEIAGEEFDLKPGNLIGIEADLFGAFGAVATGNVEGDGFAVGDDVVDEIFPDVILDSANVFAKAVMGGFAGLGHEIGDIDAGNMGASDSPGDFRDQKIRENAGVKGAGAHEDEVGLLNGFQSGGERANAARNEFQFADGKRAAGNIGFAFHALAIGKSGDEMNVGGGGRKDAAANGEDLSGNANRFSEIAGDVGERGEEEVAEVVAAETASGLESILKEAAEESFVLGERDQAIANVAGRKNAIFAAQAARAAAVVGDGDNRGEIGDRACEGRLFVAAPDDVILQATKKSGKSGAAAESDNTEGAGSPLRATIFFVADVHGCLRG